MNKTLLTLLILSFLPVGAMDLSKSIHITAKATGDTVCIQLGQQDLAEEQHHVELHLASLSQTLKNLIEDAGTENPIPLPDTTLSTWKLIHAQLQRIYNIQNNTDADNEKEALITAIKNLNSTSFVDLLCAVNYLDIPLLFNLMVEHSDLQNLTEEQFSQFPPGIARALIIKHIFEKLPPLAGKQTAILEGHTEGVYSVCMAGDKIISGSNDSTIRVWDIITGKQTAILEGHTEGVYSVCVAGDKIISGSYDKTIRIWDITTGKQTAILKGHKHDVTSVCVAGDKIISGSYDKTIRVWDITTGKQTAILKGHTVGVRSVCVIGDKIISGSYDNTIRVWDITTGNQTAILKGHTGFVTLVCEAGDKIISGSDDNTIRVWDITTGKQTAICKGHTESVTSVCVAGDKIISGSLDYTIRVWDISVLNTLQKMNTAQISAVYNYMKKCQDNNENLQWQEIENLVQNK